MRRAIRAMVSLLVGGALLSAGGAGGSTVKATRDLAVTAAVRRSIFVALAKYHQLPTKDYVGLIPKMTYYALDAKNDTYYAAAGLVASRHSLKAQVGTQDDGAYNLLTRRRGAATWKVYDDGVGAAQDSICPIRIPSSVLAVWAWKAGSCFPPITP